jgi:hypothetical protein
MSRAARDPRRSWDRRLGVPAWLLGDLYAHDVGRPCWATVSISALPAIMLNPFFIWLSTNYAEDAVSEAARLNKKGSKYCEACRRLQAGGTPR